MNLLQPQIEYLLLLQNFRELTGNVFDGFFSVITTFGETIIPILFAALMYWCINKKAGIFIIWNLALGVLLNQFLKLTMCIYRPWVLDSRVKPVESAFKYATGYSFPSGHTAISLGVWGATAFKFWNNKIIRYFSILLVLLIMFSRNYLGVHTPQDVIVSCFLGIGLLFGINKLLNWIENGKNRDIIVFTIVVLLNVFLIFYTILKSYPMDYINGSVLVDPCKMKFDTFPKTGFITGTFVGWLLDKRFIKFDIEVGTVFEKVIRFIVGTIILSILMCKTDTFFVDLLGKSRGLFLNYFICSLFITGIYPYLCQFRKNKFRFAKSRDN